MLCSLITRRCKNDVYDAISDYPRGSVLHADAPTAPKLLRSSSVIKFVIDYRGMESHRYFDLDNGCDTFPMFGTMRVQFADAASNGGVRRAYLHQKLWFQTCCEKLIRRKCHKL